MSPQAYLRSKPTSVRRHPRATSAPCVRPRRRPGLVTAAAAAAGQRGYRLRRCRQRPGAHRRLGTAATGHHGATVGGRQHGRAPPPSPSIPRPHPTPPGRDPPAPARPPTTGCPQTAGASRAPPPSHRRKDFPPSLLPSQHPRPIRGAGGRRRCAPPPWHGRAGAAVKRGKARWRRAAGRQRVHRIGTDVAGGSGGQRGWRRRRRVG